MRVKKNVTKMGASGRVRTRGRCPRRRRYVFCIFRTSRQNQNLLGIPIFSRFLDFCEFWANHLLNPLSLTPSRLPRFSANERCPFPHAFSCQRRKNRGESNILEMKFSRSPSRLIDFHREKTCVVACGTQNFFANAIVTGNSPRCDQIDEGNDSKT